MIPQTTELSQIQAAFIDKDNRIEELMRQINSAQSLLNSMKDTMNSYLVGDGKITIQTYTGSNVGDFTVNQKEDKTITLPQQATVNNGTLTIQKNGTSVGTFTANQSENTTANISVPTKTSEITNDSGFITSSDLPVVNDGTLTIKENGVTIGMFTANQSENTTANIFVPIKTSEIINDSNYISDVNYVHTDNNFTSADKTKLDGIETGAEVNVQSNWNEINAAADSYIRNKPTLALVATSGSYTDLSNQPTIPAAQVNSDWNASSGVARILNKPTIPTAVSQLTNDSGYLTASTLPSMRFTYIVDNDTKLSNWANNVAGNDYTSVLIRGSRTLNQNSSKEKQINLTSTNTKVVVGEAGSSITIGTGFGQSTGVSGILGYDALPADDSYYIQGVTIIASISSNVDYNENFRGFVYCRNLYNCKAQLNRLDNVTHGFLYCQNLINCYSDSSGCYNAIGFLRCENLINCTGKGSSNLTSSIPSYTGKAGDGHGFVTCTSLENCKGQGIAASVGSSKLGYGFSECLSVRYCKPLGSSSTRTYNNSYSSPTAQTGYACANTLNGGWNN